MTRLMRTGRGHSFGCGTHETGHTFALRNLSAGRGKHLLMIYMVDGGPAGSVRFTSRTGVITLYLSIYRLYGRSLGMFTVLYGTETTFDVADRFRGGWLTKCDLGVRWFGDLRNGFAAIQASRPGGFPAKQAQ